MKTPVMRTRARVDAARAAEVAHLTHVCESLEHRAKKKEEGYAEDDREITELMQEKNQLEDLLKVLKASKPEKKEGGEGSLNIRIRDQTGEETFFKVKKTTKLDKVFNAYSTRKGVAATSLRFLFDGSRVRGDQTPADIGMADGDQFDCMLVQQGC